MVGTLQPLGKQYPVVNADGTPTEYFIRWAQQKQIDIGNGVAASEVPAIIAAYLADHPLQAGAGITLTPTGNVANSPTIAAEVQGVLDQLSMTQGTVLYRGAADWAALAPGTSGQFLKTLGAGSDPTWATPAAGANPYTPPVAADFPTSLSIGAESFISDTSEGLAFNVGTGGSGTVLRCILKTIPTAPYTIIFKADFFGEGTGTDGAGLILRDSATGRLIKFGINFGVGSGQVLVERWTNNTTFSATTKSVTNAGNIPCFRFRNDNTNHIFEYALSIKGPWMPFLSESKTAWLANADQIGFGVEDQNLVNYMLLVRHYEQA